MESIGGENPVRLNFRFLGGKNWEKSAKEYVTTDALTIGSNQNGFWVMKLGYDDSSPNQVVLDVETTGK